MPPHGRRRASALCTRRDPAGSLRCGNTSQALRASSPQGEPALSGTGPQSLPWRGGGTRSVTERCAAAQRRRRASALCTRRNPAGSFWCGNTSQALRASSPQGEPALSGTGPQSLPWRGGGTRSVTERCAAPRAAARQRPLRTPGPCGKPSVRQHLSGAPRQLPSRGACPLRRRTPKPPLGDQGEVARRSRDGGDQSFRLSPAYNPSVSLRLTAPLTQGSLPSQASGLVCSTGRFVPGLHVRQKIRARQPSLARCYYGF